MSALFAKAKLKANISMVHIKADGTQVVHEAQSTFEHPWNNLQVWYHKNILRREIPIRGRIPKFKLW